jgi:hypothetical protein
MHAEMREHWIYNLEAVLLTRDHWHVSARRWNQMCYQILQGSERGQSSENWRFGSYEFGMFMCSNFLLQPALRSDAFLTFQVHYGQPLDIPLDEDGQAHALQEFFNTTFGQLKTINALKGLFGNTSDQYRIEPNWDDHPELFVVEVVREGEVRH